MTRSAARRYFGAESPIGQTVQIDRSTTLRVAAVIDDLPGNSDLGAEIYGSGLSPHSRLYQEDHKPYVIGDYPSNVRTYVRLADPAEARAVEARLPQIVHQRIYPPGINRGTPFAKTLVLTLAPIGKAHLLPTQGDTSSALILIWALSAIAALVLAAAGVNFVNLSTARAVRRSLEVGVRKVAGASRRQLVLQFLGEAMVYAAAGMALAVMLVEVVDPAMTGLFQHRIPFAYWRDPVLIAAILGLTLVMGLGAGLYPALVMSGFRPALALKPGATKASGSAVARYGMVVAQFAILIGLTLAVMVIGRQTWFAINQATGLNTAQVLRISAGCKGAFVERVRRLPGVEDLACSSTYGGGLGSVSQLSFTPAGQKFAIIVTPVDYGFFRFYGLKPLAGGLPSPEHGEDGLAFGTPDIWADGHYAGRLPAAAVVNQAAVRAMRLGSPEQAIGAVFRVNEKGRGLAPIRIIGVIPDYTYDLTEGPALPSFYPVIQDDSAIISVRLQAGRIPATLAAIREAWRQEGEPHPLRMRFLAEYLDALYAGVIRQAWLIGALAAVAGFISALGLFGLAAFVSEQRTKEIGVRKAFGASTADIVALLVWSFTRPVLVANLIAWPLGWWALDRWLHGFAQRISLSPWLFLAAGAAAFVIAALTVSGHALRVARAKPAGALRYE
jgi:putative ABC transport system permease protein